MSRKLLGPESSRKASVPSLATTDSSFSFGVVVPMPTLLPLWNSAEFPRVVLLFQIGMKLAVPLQLIAAMVLGAAAWPVFDVSPAGAANTNAEGGFPPTVSASAAFR